MTTLLFWFLLSSNALARQSQELLIKINQEISSRAYWETLEGLERFGVTVINEYSLVKGLILVESASSIENLKTLEGVEYAVPNFVRKVSGESSLEYSSDPEIPEKIPVGAFKSDPEPFANYGVLQNGTNKIWKDFKFYGDPKTVIAVIDTGIDYIHRDLVGNTWRNPGETVNGVDDDGNGYVDDVLGYDFINEDSLPYDDHSHGTHVAGIAAAVSGNGVDMAGQCGRCSIMALKFIGKDGSGKDSDAIRAIEYAVKNGAHIINHSWGSGDYSRALEEALIASGKAGVFTVSAAGNDGYDLSEHDMYPAKFKVPGAVAVAALYEKSLAIPYWSNYGSDFVHLTSAGNEVKSTVPGDKLENMSGTSMAAPNIAGCAGLIKSYQPNLTPEEIAELFRKFHVEGKDTLTKTLWGGYPDMPAIFASLRARP